MAEQESSQEVVLFGVPRVAVDVHESKLERVLKSRQYNSVLDFVELEATIEALGRQTFNPSMTNNIHLQPVREWVQKSWAENFGYDFSKRTLPITFRTSLAFALLSSRMQEHLERLGTIELYGSRDLQKKFEEHSSELPAGLNEVDYTSLPAELKREVILPLISQLQQARVVQQANLLYPDGIPTTAVYLCDPSLIMTTLFTETPEHVGFNGIKDLGYQSKIAAVAIKHYQKVQGFMRNLEQRANEQEKRGEPSIGEPSSRDDSDDVREQPPPLKNYSYPVGTTIFDLMKSQSDADKASISGAFHRLAQSGKYVGVHKVDRGDFIRVYLTAKGEPLGEYVFTDYGVISEDDPPLPLGNIAESIGGDNAYRDHERSEALENLLSILRDEIEQKRLLDVRIKELGGQTVFTVETGFMEALTGRWYHRGYSLEEATPEQIAEYEVLIREAMVTMGQAPERDFESTSLTRISDQPVHEGTLDLDYRILDVLSRYHGSPETLLAMSMAGNLVFNEKIGEWFKQCQALLEEYRAVMARPEEQFEKLGLPPDADVNAVKVRYREIAHETHPDVTMHLPLTPERRIEEVARFQAATEAFHDITNRADLTSNSLAPIRYLGRISEMFVVEEKA